MQQDEKVRMFQSDIEVGGQLGRWGWLGATLVGTYLMKVAYSMHFEVILIDDISDGAFLPHDNYITSR